MKRYHRFHRDTARTPTLFFVALFVLGTAALGGMFVFGDRKTGEQSSASASGGNNQQATTPAPLLAIDNNEYRAAARAALDAFVADASRVMGGWVDDPAWEQRVRQPGALTGIDRAASQLRETLIDTRVPANARTRHLLLVVTVEELLEGLRNDRVDVLEGSLLKLGEWRVSL